MYGDERCGEDHCDYDYQQYDGRVQEEHQDERGVYAFGGESLMARERVRVANPIGSGRR